LTDTVDQKTNRDSNPENADTPIEREAGSSDPLSVSGANLYPPAPAARQAQGKPVQPAAGKPTFRGPQKVASGAAPPAYGKGAAGTPDKSGAPAGKAQQPAGPQVNMREIQFTFGQAQQALRQGRKQEAAAACRQILQLVPDHLGALRLLAALRREAGDWQTAGELISRALRTNPHSDQVLVEAAQTLENTGRMARAEQNYSRAARINPQNVDAQVGLARAAQHRGDTNSAEYHFRQAHFLQPGAPGIAAALAGVLSTLARFDESERFFRIATSLAPKDAGTLINWARMEESRGDVTRAEALLDKARELRADFPMIGMTEAQIHLRNKKYDEALAALDKIQVDQIRPAAQASYWYDRGRILDRAQRYDEAFEAYDKANRINREKNGLQYKPEHVRDLTKRLKEFFTAEKAAELPRAQGVEGEPVPIFVCGFTRSGTTLMEQTLGSHRHISPADELFFVAQLAEHSPAILQSQERYPQCLNELIRPDKKHLVQQLRQRYLARVRLIGILDPGATRFTDKMPMNEMHMGLIELAFPDAHFVHMIRHPLDTVLASYFIDARHGRFCSYDLESAATHYATLMDMVDHYRKAMPDIHYMMVRYEDLVADHAKQTRLVLDFLGEEWDDNCVEYYKNKRQARTPSYADVKEKIYTDSTYRYRNYVRHVEKIVPILEPYIKRFGYTLD
jgi:tetratricopeptide (TPR) repeat protein